MITLKVAEYCQNCKRFEGSIERTTYTVPTDPCRINSKIITDTVIRCVHADECANMYDYIMRETNK